METDYQLYLWAENGGQSFETTVNFTTPRPTQPYDSWTWNADKKVWVPPVSYPEDGKFYEWDEDTTNWIEETITIEN
jgi:hypothetical protein